MSRKSFWPKAILIVVLVWLLLLEPAQRRTAIAQAVTTAAQQVQRLAGLAADWAQHWERELAP